MNLRDVTRRQLFRDCGIGFGKVALGSMLATSGTIAKLAAAAFPERGYHHSPRVKRVIYLFMAGAPSQLDLFDYKPKLVELEGKVNSSFGDCRTTIRFHSA